MRLPDVSLQQLAACRVRGLRKPDNLSALRCAVSAEVEVDDLSDSYHVTISPPRHISQEERILLFERLTDEATAKPRMSATS